MATDTQLEAYSGAQPTAPILRDLVKQVLARDAALTPDEIAARLGMSVLSIRPRITELKQSGEIEDTGERRPNRSGRNAAVFALSGRKTQTWLW